MPAADRPRRAVRRAIAGSIVVAAIAGVLVNRRPGNDFMPAFVAFLLMELAIILLMPTVLRRWWQNPIRRWATRAAVVVCLGIDAAAHLLLLVRFVDVGAFGERSALALALLTILGATLLPFGYGAGTNWAVPFSVASAATAGGLALSVLLFAPLPVAFEETTDGLWILPVLAFSWTGFAASLAVSSRLRAAARWRTAAFSDRAVTSRSDRDRLG